MLKSRRTWWLIYVACAVAAVAGLLWVTVVLLRLERDEHRARAETEQQESLRLALWRMDSWLAPRLAREAARPYFEYRSYYPTDRAYANFFNAIVPGEQLAPSPLLTFESQVFPLHFQITDSGELTSPQVPAGDLESRARRERLVDDEVLALRSGRLDELRTLLVGDTLDQCMNLTDALPEQLVLALPPLDEESVRLDADNRTPAERTQSQQQRSAAEQIKRAQIYNQAQSVMVDQSNVDCALAPDAPSIEVTPFVPAWIGSGPRIGHAGPLVLVRRVSTADETILQGVVMDWMRLRDQLIGEIRDLYPAAQFPAAQLVPVSGAGPPPILAGRVLATIPLRLDTGPLPVIGPVVMTPARVTLVLTWLAIGVAVAAIGITLRASIAFGERRSRFASAVTHELRTPLTTFRMYSEMLADDMVRDEAQRKDYLVTLKDESARLATLVENVLTFARVEDGRTALTRTPVTMNALLDRVRPPLERRVTEADMMLDIECDDAHAATTIQTDADAVGQVLLNLVDNACKYAAGAEPRSVHLTVTAHGSAMSLQVRDHGPGIDPAYADDLFVAFDRGARPPGDTVPGIGLGLALSRGLARDLGGDLTLEPAAPGETGARFRMTLPLHSAKPY